MRSDCDFDLVDLGDFRLNVEGLGAEAAAIAIQQFLAEIADRVNFERPDLYKPGELERASGFTVAWDCWDYWPLSFVSHAGLILCGYRPLRIPEIYTDAAVQSSPRIQFRSHGSRIPHFCLSAWSGSGLSIAPRIRFHD